MKFTKAQRHKYYKEALQEGRGLIDNGICDRLSKMVDRDFGRDSSCDEMQYLFPELGKRKPIEEDSWWWPLDEDGLKIRIKVLKACIRETAPKKRLNSKQK